MVWKEQNSREVGSAESLMYLQSMVTIFHIIESRAWLQDGLNKLHNLVPG